MKKIIIVIAISVFSVFTANAQKSANYIPFANSNNDTLQYLANNFRNQKLKYIGQPLSKIFNDLELKILYHSPINRVPSGNEGGANINWIPGGKTSGGTSEAIVDLSNKSIPYVPIN